MNDQEALRAVCDDVELITGIKTVIYDENRKMIHSQPNLMCDFCKEIRRSPALAQKCLQCDEYGFSKCVEKRDLFVYRCHMGLVEAVAPIMESGIAIGYLMLGQLLPENGRQSVQEQIEALGKEVDKATLRQHLAAMAETDEAHLHATARILAMSAAYVRFHEWLKQREDTTAYKIERCVYENIGKESLSAQSVGAALGFSRTALYNVSIKNFGMGVSAYIRKTRAEHAIRLLRTTSLSLAHVAESVGLPSPARLTRLLKAEAGMTAKQIRAAAKSAEGAT